MNEGLSLIAALRTCTRRPGTFNFHVQGHAVTIGAGQVVAGLVLPGVPGPCRARDGTGLCRSPAGTRP